MSSGAVARGEITINCDDFSKSPYVTALNDFEEGLIDGRMFESRYTSWIKSSEGIKCPNIK
jgi:hypothetical protein